MIDLIRHFGAPPSIVYATVTLCGVGAFCHALVCFAVSLWELWCEP